MRKLSAVVAIVCVSACSSSKHSPQAASRTTTSAGANGATASSSPATTAVPVSTSTTVVVSSTHQMGQSVTVAGGTLTVFSYTAPTTPNDKNASAAPAGQMYATVDVQFCIGAAAGESAGPAEFALRLANGVDVHPRVGVRDPAFIVHRLQAHQCNRGFITFQIASGEHASAVVDATSANAWQIA